MKQTIILIATAATLILSSCANVEKLVDRGEYDQAIHIATKKLAGKKNKKEKYVKAAEEAFAKITRRDMDRISRLKERDGLNDWKKIYTISSDMQRRQRKIEPLLPLIDMDGYHAGFKFVRAEVIIDQARNEISSRLYEVGRNYLAAAQVDDKIAARHAYENFREIGQYKANYKDTHALLKRALDLGTTHVLIKMENKSPYIFPGVLEDEILRFYRTGRQSKWKQFYMDEKQAPRIDVFSRIAIRDLQISPEQQQEVIHHFVKQIQEEHIARDENGRAMVDSSGNNIIVYVPKEIEAEVVEINQFKEAVLSMTVELFDYNSKTLLDRERFDAVGQFDNKACRIFGDRRAIRGNWLTLGAPQPFPTDEALVVLAAEQLKDRIGDVIVDFDYASL